MAADGVEDGEIPESPAVRSKFPAKFAMKCLDQSLQLLTGIFGVPLCLDKLDLIAVPRMTLGGMEREDA